MTSLLALQAYFLQSVSDKRVIRPILTHKWTETRTRDFLSVFDEARQLLFERKLLIFLFFAICIFLESSFFYYVVSGDNANTLKDMPTKGGREEKEVFTALTTTTEATTTTTSLSINVQSNEFETEATTESFWKEGELAEESQPGQPGIRNTSDARGIFSNMVKTLNRCKYTWPI